MIELIPQTVADREGLNPALVQSISPYLNPAHVLSPPRDWLEALVHGETSWPFFRLRYKDMLRKRFLDEPARFYNLLQASQGSRKMYLACHCLTSHCHREIAREFLEHVREEEDYGRWLAAQNLPILRPVHLVEHPLGRH